MARFETKGLDELLKELEYYGESVGPVADKMLEAGADEVRKCWKESAERHRLRDTGDMIKSIGYSRAAVNAGDIQSIDIYPQGKDGKGVRNAEKAFILHYGLKGSNSVNAQRKRKKKDKIPGPGIPATHWVDDADKASAEPVQAVYERIWGDYLKGLK